MYANNRFGEQPRASFRSAGGTIYQFSHPFLTGQVDATGITKNILSSVNTVNVSRSLRLNDTFFNAQPLQDNALMEVMVDGSTVTITNHVMAGRATLNVLPTTGLVKDGDMTAIAPFIMASKDNVGGILARRRFVDGGALTRIYYGCTFANFPHDIDIGNGLPVYPIVMLYAGWFEGLTKDSTTNNRLLWAVGNANGLSGTFEMFDIMEGDITNPGAAASAAASSGVSDVDDETTTGRAAQYQNTVPGTTVAWAPGLAQQERG